MDLTKEVKIRKMTETDIIPIATLERRIAGISRPNTWEAEIRHYLGDPESICLVAVVDGKGTDEVVGFMIGSIHAWLFGVERGGWIEVLGVDPEHTAKGIGKRLGEEMFKEFKQREVKVVHTSVDWFRSTDILEFFKTLGMEKSDFITLRKDLQ
ncbi:MAG: GNAT family N-acetyltransferase [Candidatus Thorarchaeota archaeon]